MTNFPYHKTLEGYFPIIKLDLYYKNNVSETSALIDSGATVSVFRAEMGEQLGIDIEKGQEMYLGGVGGHIKGYLHKLEVRIAGKKFLCPIVFSREYVVSFNLLGREEFFKRFTITFEEKKNRLNLE